jgi:hypothetical protein
MKVNQEMARWRTGESPAPSHVYIDGTHHHLAYFLTKHIYAYHQKTINQKEECL